MGFLGPESIEAQVDHALGFASTVEGFLEAADMPLPSCFLDLGSGGGLPGLLLAHRWGRVKAVLLDSSLRKSEFLEAAVSACGWGERVRVIRSRAEEAARSELRGKIDLVVARSFAPPPVTAECAAGFLKVGGLLVVSEPPSAATTSMRGSEDLPGSEVGADRWPDAGIALLGLERLGISRDRFGYAVLRQSSACPDRFPRRVGKPGKRPLWAPR